VSGSSREEELDTIEQQIVKLAEMMLAASQIHNKISIISARTVWHKRHREQFKKKPVKVLVEEPRDQVPQASHLRSVL
jgi:hypothetical protein